MHHINITDDLYRDLVRRASATGFPSVDEYAAELLSHDHLETPNLDAFFTSERLAAVDDALKEAEGGKVKSLDEVMVGIRQRGDKWDRDHGK